MAETQPTGFDKSNSTWRNRAELSIAHGALTNSKRPSTFIDGVYPSHLASGTGCIVTDTFGKRYIDFICGLGTNLIGYANEEINRAVALQMQKGSVLSLGTPIEVECAEAVKSVVPFVDRVRFLKTGTEACMAAIRIARAYHAGEHRKKELLKVLEDKTSIRIPQELISQVRTQELVQELRKRISKAAASNGDKTTGSETLCEDKEGNFVGKKTLRKKAGADKGAGPGQSLLQSEEITKEAAMLGMWLDKITSASPGLLSAIDGDLVMPDSSLESSSPRLLVLSDGYHGHSDQFISLTQPHYGVPDDHHIAPLSSKILNGRLNLSGHVAAVIVEPVVSHTNLDERKKYLEMLREECSRVGALLIFDEVITGFRFPQLSVSRYLGVEPDLICMGKAIGGGLPLSVVAGKRFHMEADYFVSSTFAGDTLSLAASLKFMSLIRSKYNIENLWENGVKFMREFNEIAPNLVRLEGYPTRGILAGDKAARDLFFQETCKAGILFGPSWFLSFPHIPMLPSVISTCRDILTRIKTGSVKLEGQPSQVPFAQKVRG